MKAIFDTLQDYLDKRSEVNQYLGYPNARGTDTYCDDVPLIDVNGKHIMPIDAEILHLFDGCVIVETVEYPQEEITE